MPATPIKLNLNRQSTMNYSRFSFTRAKKNHVHIPEQNDILLKGDGGGGGGGDWAAVDGGHDGDEHELLVCGYKRSWARTSLAWLLTALTLGAARLVFHWVPHWLLRSTCAPCPVPQAQYVLIAEKYKNKHKLYYVKEVTVLTCENVSEALPRMGEERADVASSDGEPVLQVQYGDGVFSTVERLVIFACKKTRYAWDVEVCRWRRLRGLDAGVRADALHAAVGTAPLSERVRVARRLVYGSNEIAVREKTVGALLVLELLNPFYIFQLLSFTLWFLDDYYYYALAILTISAAGVATAVAQTRRNQRNLRSSVRGGDVAAVVGLGALPTESLVLGDVLEIPAHGCVMHCDAVLLVGNCIVNESMLTGESVPVTKTALHGAGNSATAAWYDAREHQRHTLFSGTHVIQTRWYGGERVLALVVRTGWMTSKGGLVRSILYPPPVDFRFERDSYRWVALLAATAALGFLYTVVTKAARGAPATELLLKALDLVTIVVPPALPAAMTVGRMYAQRRLRQQGIYCVAPRTINVAGGVDCVCFDKTGTLTEDGLDLLCAVPVREDARPPLLDAPLRDVRAPHAVALHPRLVHAMASCHSLTLIDGRLCGDPLDLKMFESTGWLIEEHDTSDATKFNMLFPTVVRAPPQAREGVPRTDDDDDRQIGIIKEFPFSSGSQRMGVIVRQLRAQHFEYYCKGSPEMLLNLCRADTVPADFTHVLQRYAQQGYRVIALARRELARMSYAKVQRAQRDVLEQDLQLLGLIVLENRLKPDTAPCIAMLNHANIRCVMVTGDNLLTAVSVARECGIVTSAQSVITVGVSGDGGAEPYYTLASSTRFITASTAGGDYSAADSASIASVETVESALNSLESGCTVAIRPTSLYNNYRLALTGETWAAVRERRATDDDALLRRIVTRGAVFARMSPEQKQQLIEELQALGYCVAMCGDGANDCGALRAAHAGVSLSDAESSVASPFTSRTGDVSCVPAIIREGRAALVTSFGIFKYMAAYSLCQFASVMTLYSIDSNLTDIQYLYVDLFIISIFAFFFGRTRAYQGKLVRNTPLASLMSVSPVLSLALQLALAVAFQVAALQHTRAQPWFTPHNYTAAHGPGSDGCYENYAIFSVSSFQYVILALAFSKGKPYRESIFSNYGFVLSAVVVTAFSAYLALYPPYWLRNAFELVLPPDMNFRLLLLLYPFANFALSMAVELLVIEQLVFKRLRFRYHNIDKSKRKYLAVERDLQKDAAWPTLTSEVKSSPSLESLTTTPRYEAEIVVENENRFDKNHVLNSILLDAAGLAVSCEQLHSVGGQPGRRLPPRLAESAPSVFRQQSRHSVLEMDSLTPP